MFHQHFVQTSKRTIVCLMRALRNTIGLLLMITDVIAIFDTSTARVRSVYIAASFV